MAILRPDEYKHNNSDYAIVDNNNVRGAYATAVGAAGRDAIPLDKRALGQTVDIGEDVYRYTGAGTTDVEWEDVANWELTAEKLKRIIFIEQDSDFADALNTEGEVLGIVVTNTVSLSGSYTMVASRVTIVGAAPIRISNNVTIVSPTSGVFGMLLINVAVLMDSNYSISHDSSLGKTLLIHVNYLGTYPTNAFSYTLTLSRIASGVIQFTWNNISPNVTIVTNAGTSQSYNLLSEGYFISELESESLLFTKGTGTEVNRWDINLPEKTYDVEWFSPSAWVVNEDWNPATEIDIAHDYAIMPKIIQNIKTGVMYHWFAVSSGHNVFTNRIAVFRKSVDGGDNWAGLDGTGTYTAVDFFGDSSTVDMAGGGTTQTGRLIVFFRKFISGVLENMYSAYSDDEGITWSTPYDHGYSVSYVFDNKFCRGKKGEILICTGYGSAGSAERRQDVLQSFDNGVSWSARSTIYDPGISGYTFGEFMMRDFGDGLFVAIGRNANSTISSGTFIGMDLPMLFISRDYGQTWADGVETVTQSQLNAGEVNSGWLPLEGTSVDLGDGTYENCLPLFERVDYNGHKYILIVYYLRDEITIDATTRDELLRMTAIKLDEWLAKGWKAIKEDIAVTIYEANDTSSNQYDGNGMMFVPKNRSEILWTICDNLTSSETGNEIITSGRINKATIEALLDSIETANSIS